MGEKKRKEERGRRERTQAQVTREIKNKRAGKGVSER